MSSSNYQDRLTPPPSSTTVFDDDQQHEQPILNLKFPDPIQVKQLKADNNPSDHQSSLSSLSISSNTNTTPITTTTFKSSHQSQDQDPPLPNEDHPNQSECWSIVSSLPNQNQSLNLSDLDHQNDLVNKPEDQNQNQIENQYQASPLPIENQNQPIRESSQGAIDNHHSSPIDDEHQPVNSQIITNPHPHQSIYSSRTILPSSNLKSLDKIQDWLENLKDQPQSLNSPLTPSSGSQLSQITASELEPNHSASQCAYNHRFNLDKLSLQQYSEIDLLLNPLRSEEGGVDCLLDPSKDLSSSYLEPDQLHSNQFSLPAGKKNSSQASDLQPPPVTTHQVVKSPSISNPSSSSPAQKAKKPIPPPPSQSTSQISKSSLTRQSGFKNKDPSGFKRWSSLLLNICIPILFAFFILPRYWRNQQEKPQLDHSTDTPITTEDDHLTIPVSRAEKLSEDILFSGSPEPVVPGSAIDTAVYASSKESVIASSSIPIPDNTKPVTQQPGQAPRTSLVQTSDSPIKQERNRVQDTLDQSKTCSGKAENCMDQAQSPKPVDSAFSARRDDFANQRPEPPFDIPPMPDLLSLTPEQSTTNTSCPFSSLATVAILVGGLIACYSFSGDKKSRGKRSEQVGDSRNIRSIEDVIDVLDSSDGGHVSYEEFLTGLMSFSSEPADLKRLINVLSNRIRIKPSARIELGLLAWTKERAGDLEGLEKLWTRFWNEDTKLSAAKSLAALRVVEDLGKAWWVKSRMNGLGAADVEMERKPLVKEESVELEGPKKTRRASGGGAKIYKTTEGKSRQASPNTTVVIKTEDPGSDGDALSDRTVHATPRPPASASKAKNKPKSVGFPPDHQLVLPPPPAAVQKARKPRTSAPVLTSHLPSNPPPGPSTRAATRASARLVSRKSTG